MSEKIDTYKDTKETKRKQYKGSIIVKPFFYRVGQWITDNVFYAGQATKEEREQLLKKLKNKKN